MLPPTTRFSNRVADYVRYRPGYPAELLVALADQIGFNNTWRVADVGSGTGKLTELFLSHKNPVYGIEPNKEMREAGESLLAEYPNFTSIDATAEATTLADGSVDLVVAGQAFHWFDADSSKQEFKRILAPGGWVALIWNDRKCTGTEFLDGYNDLLNQFPEYLAVGHKAAGAMKVEAFFDAGHQMWSKPTTQEFGWEGLLGRALSSCYVPAKGAPGHDPFVRDLKALFDQTSDNGSIQFFYETQMFLGQA